MRFDPSGVDPALSNMLLVGHSMGGLISKLQITYSENKLWESVSCRAFQDIITTNEARAKLADSFYFEPSPQVSRVVFIGTPHRGSPYANRPIGRLGSKLVEESSSMEAIHRQLIRDNPNAFSKEFTKRIPTSIDLLKPQSPMLQATDRLVHNPTVALHSIVGKGYWMFGGGESDSVVPVASARLAGSQTEKFIHAKHTKLNKIQPCIAELMRVMRMHLHAVDGQMNRRNSQTP